jgi:hypothetical protein
VNQMPKRTVLLITTSLILWLAVLSPQHAFAQSLAADAPSAQQGNPAQAQTGNQQQGPGQVRAPQENAVSLSGIRAYTPGPTGEERSFLLPSLQITGNWDSNPYYQPGGPSELYVGTGAWSLGLQRIKRRSQLNLSYAGGEIVSSRPLPSSFGTNLGKYETYQSLELAYEYNGLRWKSTLMDQFSFLPESSFGFSGFTGLPGFGAGLGLPISPSGTPLSNGLVPNQSILTGYTRRIGNVSAAETDYSFTPRTSLSMSGSYGLLQYISSGLYDTDFYGGSIGLDHLLTRRDQLGLAYQYEYIGFAGLSQNIEIHSAQIAYGRKLTGKLSLKLSAGPMLDIINQPVGPSTTRIFASTSDSLRYLLQGGDLHLNYIRYTSPGAGVFFGAETDQVSAGLSHRILRRYFFSLDAGYAQNKSLSGVGIIINDSKFNTVQGGVTLSTALGERMSFFMSYRIQQQSADTSVCAAGQCGRSFLRNFATVGINWHGRPIPIH